MKKTVNYQAGFGPLVVIIILAIIAAGGVGTYSAIKKSQARKAVEAHVEADASENSNGNSMGVQATSSVVVGTNTGTFRSLLARGKDVVCTLSTNVASGSSNGTVYISGTMMRGDFTTTSSGSVVESHMIKNGDTMYSWSGNQGAKINVDTSGQASAQSQSSFNLDQSVVGYECKDWNKDSSKFTVPSSVTFVDLNAMMNANGVKLPGNAKIDMSGKVKMGY
ncbi:MAG: hypothetical protein V4481_00065 [Patescibacteria group bacterium]